MKLRVSNLSIILIFADRKEMRHTFSVSGSEKYFALPVSDIMYFFLERKKTFAVTYQNNVYIIGMLSGKRFVNPLPVVPGMDCQVLYLLRSVRLACEVWR